MVKNGVKATKALAALVAAFSAFSYSVSSRPGYPCIDSRIVASSHGFDWYKFGKVLLNSQEKTRW